MAQCRRMKSRAPSIGPLRRKLLAWFSANRRDLPWRRTRDPYRIWLSEIMLQQTRVAAVIPYYERFLARFPGVRALAEAPEEEVLRLWSGLGYYSRAKNLHRAAQQIVTRGGAEFPHGLSEALALPGIGRYTAAAILSIAYGEPLAVLDGNVARVIARLEAIRGNLREPRRWRRLQASADHLLDSRAPGDWNQAMMELGATVCAPRAPRCDECPLARGCRARKLGLIGSIPERRSKRATVRIRLAAAVLLDSHNMTLLLPPAPHKQESGVAALFSRMWHFPAVVVQSSALADLRRLLTKSFGVAALRAAEFEPLPSVRHAVTYREISLTPYRVRVRRLPRPKGARRLALSLISQLPVSNLTRKAASAVSA